MTHVTYFIISSKEWKQRMGSGMEVHFLAKIQLRGLILLSCLLDMTIQLGDS